jgi:hypothetical protein
MMNDRGASFDVNKRWQRRIGTLLLAVVVIFLALDAGMKIAGVRAAVTATAEFGFSEGVTRLLGLVLAAATLLYSVPVCRTLGAVVLTGYLGGAVAVQAANGSPLATHVLFGLYLGTLTWAARWLRDEPIRALMPLQRNLRR